MLQQDGRSFFVRNPQASALGGKQCPYLIARKPFAGDRLEWNEVHAVEAEKSFVAIQPQESVGRLRQESNAARRTLGLFKYGLLVMIERL